MGRLIQFEIKDIILAIAFAIIGFMLSTGFAVRFIDSLGAVVGFLVMTVFIVVMMVVLSLFGLIIFKFRNVSDGVFKAIGLLMITFAFFIITSQTSCYQNLVLEKSCDVCSSYFQSPDGAVWHLVSNVTNPVGSVVRLQLTRIITYVIVPALLALFGGLLVKGSPKMEV